jgi:NADP-dependent 3-hydroxy acid dehydrogenase YdfG
MPSGVAGRPIAFVTGASRGIGRAVALSLASSGHDLGIAGRDADALAAVAEEVLGQGARVSIQTGDVADPGDVRRMLTAVEADLGPLGVVVNAAGIAQRSLTPLESFEIHEWDANIATNLRGAFLVCRHALAGLKDRGRGAIVNVGSTGSHRSLPGNAAYAASKFGVRALHESLVEECEGTGVRVHLVSPGPVDTPIWNAKAVPPSDELRNVMLRPQDVADVVVWLLTRPPRVRIDEVIVRPRRLPDDAARF